MEEIEYDPLAGMRPAWLVTPLVWVADKMSAPFFIVEFVLFLVAWMVWNTVGPMYFEFDKAPFMALNLFMSALAGIQCSVIGVKQTIAEYNRDFEARRHDAKYDAIIEHNEALSEQIISLEEQILSALCAPPQGAGQVHSVERGDMR
jgi:uncharacterized membrane protein